MATLILLAAGEGKRVGKNQNKVLIRVKDKPILNFSLELFSKHKSVSHIVVVARSEDLNAIKKIIEAGKFKKVKSVITGGETRQESVLRGLKNLKNAKKGDIILIHNAANPLVTEQEITKVIRAAEKYKAAAVGSNLTDTVKLVNGNRITKTLDRELIWTVQTPQAIEFETFMKAYEDAKHKKFKATDDLSLVEKIGVKPHIVKSSEYNFKITTALDLELFKILIGQTPEEYLTGIGEDSHKFSKKKEMGLRLGGAVFQEYKKLEADSDGDIIIHALCNAISSCLGEKSLGSYATEMKNKGVTSSVEYLGVILEKMEKKGYQINNVSISLECKEPEIDPIAGEIQKSLAGILNLERPKVGITATSGENLTEFGQGKAIHCLVQACLKKG